MPWLTTHPNGNGATQEWDVSAYTNVDDGDEQPTAPSDGNTCNHSGAAEPVDCEWTVTDVPVTAGSTATKVCLWVYNSAGTLNTVNVKINSVWQTSNSTVEETVGSWKRFDFSIDEDISSGLSGNEIRVTTATSCTVDGAYLDWLYSTAGQSGHWYYFAQQGPK